MDVLLHGAKNWQLSEPKHRDLRVRQGDGTTTGAQKGGDGLGSCGHQPHKGANGIAMLDHHGSGLAPRPGAPGHEAETGLWPAGWQAVQRGAPLPGWGLKGAARTLEGGGAATSHCPAMGKAGRMPTIQEQPRHRPRPTRGRPRWGNQALQALRDRVARTLAWEDTWKRLGLRFEHHQPRHEDMKLMAYTLIHFRTSGGSSSSRL